MRILLTTFNAKYIHSNLALYSLRENCDYGDILIKEFTINQPLLDTINETYKAKPDYIMISTYIWNIQRTLEYIKEIKKVLPTTKIYLGGPEVSYGGRTLLDDYPEIDGLFINEGEMSFKEFVAAIENHQDVIKIDGLMHRNNPVNMRPTADFDEIRFPYNEEVINNLENKIIYYESSRGCPFNCAYCLSSLDKNIRFKDLDLVKKEVGFLIDQGVSQIKFIDRTFNINLKRAKDFFTYILNLGERDVNFHFEVSGDYFDDETLSILNQLPDKRVQLEVGLQSTNKETLSICNRKTDIDKVEENLVKLSKNDNIHIHLDLIAGLPGENYESFIKSYNDAYHMKPDMLQLGFLKVLKGSPMEALKEQYEITHLSTPPYEVLSTRDISFEELQKLKAIEDMTEKYYNSSILRNFCNIIPELYRGGAANFFLEFADFEEVNQTTKGVLGKFILIQDYILNHAEKLNRGSNTGEEVFDLIPEIILYDYMLGSKNKMAAQLLHAEDQNVIFEHYGKDRELLEIVMQTLSKKDLKNTFKATRLMMFDHRMFQYLHKNNVRRLIMPELKQKVISSLEDRKIPLEDREIYLFDFEIKKGIHDYPQVFVL